MAILEPESAGEQFLALLREACRKVQDRWYLLPVDSVDADRAYRERAYCYELYHQLRAQTECGTLAGAPDYVVSGEIDKAGLNAIIEGGEYKPDVVWHVPGKALNGAVGEVKATERWSDAGVRKDLAALTTFQMRYRETKPGR